MLLRQQARQDRRQAVLLPALQPRLIHARLRCHDRLHARRLHAQQRREVLVVARQFKTDDLVELRQRLVGELTQRLPGVRENNIPVANPRA